MRHEWEICPNLFENGSSKQSVAVNENIRTCLALCLSVAAASALAAPTEQGAPIVASRAAGPIVIDGNLTDAGWQGATKVTTWYETNPGDNVEPQVKNVGYLTYDEKFLYAGFEFADRSPQDPGALRRPRQRLQHDRLRRHHPRHAGTTARRAILFLANPRGIQYDAITDDATGEDSSPDFYWDSAARITPEGWVLEMRVPFSSLRYAKKDPQKWSIMLYRNHPRDFRYQYFSTKLPRGGNCFICRSNPLDGPHRPALRRAPRHRAVRDGEPGRRPERRRRIAARDRVGRGRRRPRPEVDARREHRDRRDAESRLLADRVGRRADRSERALRPLLPGEAAVLPGGDRALLDADPGGVHAHDHVAALGPSRDREVGSHRIHGARRRRPGRRERHPPGTELLGPRRSGVPVDRRHRPAPARARCVVRELPRDDPGDPRQRRRRLQPPLRARLPLEPLRQGHDHGSDSVFEEPKRRTGRSSRTSGTAGSYPVTPARSGSSTSPRRSTFSRSTTTSPTTFEPTTGSCRRSGTARTTPRPAGRSGPPARSDGCALT